MYFNLIGKAILQGIYHTDLAIPTIPSVAQQLLFYFMMETTIDEPFQSLAVEVTLPETQPVRQPVYVLPPAAIIAANPDRTHLYYRHPLLIPNPSLRPGRIVAKVIHESGEMILATPWITHLAPAQTGGHN
jgi:hypothetical protein